MNTISANDLTTRGIEAIEDALANQSKATVWVRGKHRYVVIRHEEYLRLRECELEAALAESRADLGAGCFAKETVAQDLKRLTELADEDSARGPR